MEKSIQNLKAAFAGESQANRKYLAFAEKAEKEGYAQVARLFRAAAAAETVHAMNHLRALKAINATADNLKEAVAGDRRIPGDVSGHDRRGPGRGPPGGPQEFRIRQ